MTTHWACEQFDEAAPELALGLLDGQDRAATLEHTQGCPRCRREAAELTGTVDQLLMDVPPVEPASDFEGRVLASLDALPPAFQASPRWRLLGGGQGRWGTRSRWNRRMVIALATVAAALMLVVGTWQVVTIQERPSTRIASMVAADGRRIGKVELGRSPSTVLVSLPGWYDSGATATPYRLRIDRSNGGTVDAGPVNLSAGGTWAGVLPLDPSQVRAVSLVDSGGRVLCHASLA